MCICISKYLVTKTLTFILETVDWSGSSAVLVCSSGDDNIFESYRQELQLF